MVISYIMFNSNIALRLTYPHAKISDALLGYIAGASEPININIKFITQ